MSAAEYSQSDSAASSATEEAEPHQVQRSSPLEFAASVYNRVLIYLVLYVLSVGPAFWYWMESMYLEGNPWIKRFYYPLLVLCDWIPPLGDLVNWYIRLWWNWG